MYKHVKMTEVLKTTGHTW